MSTETKPEFICEEEYCYVVEDNLPAAIAHLEASGHALTARAPEEGVSTLRVSFAEDDGPDGYDYYDEDNEL